jgi:hypothetical protein
LPHSGLRGATYYTHKEQYAYQITVPTVTIVTLKRAVIVLKMTLTHESYLGLGHIFREVQRPLSVTAELLLGQLDVALLCGGG